MKDLTKGSPIKLILGFMLPLLVGNLFQTLYTSVDMLIVGQVVGKEALAAIGATGSFMFLIVGFAQGLSTGVTLRTAQMFGAKDEQGVRKSFATSIIICGITAILLTILALLITKPLLVFMHNPKETIHMSITYISIIFSGIIVTIFFNLLSNAIRALGDSKTPLYFLIIASVIHVFLAILFIAVFRLGVAGAALSTIIAETISVLLCMLLIKKKIPLLVVHKKDFIVGFNDVWIHLKIGVSMAIQSSIIAVGGLVVQSSINALGTDTMAGHTAAANVDMFTIMPISSIGLTVATYVAQNFGAGKFDRIKKGVTQAVSVAAGFAIVAGGLVFIFGKYIVNIYIGNADISVISISKVFFSVNCPLYFFLATIIVIRSSILGLGRSLVPNIVAVIELVARASAAIFLGKLLGYTGIVIGNPLAWIGGTLLCIPSFIYYYKKLKANSEKYKLSNHELKS